MIVGGLISLCCAILGVTLVLKRYSMIGDGLSHVAFGSMTIAMVLTIADMYVMMPVTILSMCLQNSLVKTRSTMSKMTSTGRSPIWVTAVVT